MNKSNSIEAIDRTDLSEQIKFRLDEISKIENFFHEETNQRKFCSKKLSKYVAVFDYIDQALIGVSISLFTSIVGKLVGIACASLTLFFSVATGIVKKLLNIKRNKKKKHDEILMLAKSKLNSIETLVSQALIDMEKSHEEFTTILKKKDKYEKMKDNLRSENEKYEIMRLSSVKSKTQMKNSEKVLSILCHQKNLFFFLCMYKMDSFALFTANAWRKNDAEVLEYGDKIQINQGHFQEKLGIANIADRTQYYSNEFKKMRCEIQECGKYQPCRMFIENTLAVEITMSAVKTQAAIFKSKFGVNQHDKVLRKQQSLGLRLKKLFPNENIIEEYFDLHYRTDFTFIKNTFQSQKLMKKDMLTEIQIVERKDKKNWKCLATTSIE